jgi:hypothetical protein
LPLSCTLDIAVISLVLNPKEKMAYLKKHWSAELQEEVLKCVEEEVYPTSCPPFQELILVQRVVATIV